MAIPILKERIFCLTRDKKRRPTNFADVIKSSDLTSDKSVKNYPNFSNPLTLLFTNISIRLYLQPVKVPRLLLRELKIYHYNANLSSNFLNYFFAQLRTPYTDCMCGFPATISEDFKEAFLYYTVSYFFVKIYFSAG